MEYLNRFLLHIKKKGELMAKTKERRNCIPICISVPMDLLTELENEADELKINSRSEYIVQILKNRHSEED